MTVCSRSASVALATLLGAAAVLTSNSSANASPAPDEGRSCVYGDIVSAPKGAIPRDDSMVQTRDPLAKWVKAHPRAAKAAAAGATVTVPVAVHVIRKDLSVAGGNIPEAWINDQIGVLNTAYSGGQHAGAADTGFQFELASVDRTTKASWFRMNYTSGDLHRFVRGSSKEIKMKQKLSTRDPGTLDLYTANLGRLLLGYAYLPSDFAEGLPQFFDGVVVDYRSLPGGPYGDYAKGDTATHEVGHWLNLEHTFQNGCEAPGDFVADTPYEASPAFNCPVGRDTCADDAGLDPIHNFMDYTVDPCMYEFTDGQTVRMQQAWAAYRS
jgi:hypothetical protein